MMNMSNEDRVTTYSVKKNRFENVHVSYEMSFNTPVVSVRSFRGDKFTGKGLSLQPELWEQLLKEIPKAIHALRTKLASEDVAVEQITTAPKKAARKDAEVNRLSCEEITRQCDERTLEINADATMTAQQRHDALKELGEWAYKEAEYLIFDEE
jgi:hypothetical protein